MDATLAQLLEALMQQNHMIQQLQTENATLKEQLTQPPKDTPNRQQAD